LEEAAVADLSEQAVENVLTKLVGVLTLPVSAYSAIKKDGVPMYKRARAAAKVGDFVKEVPIREMRVHEVELLDVYHKNIQGNDRIILKIRFLVGSGTYIRSLGEEIGRQLGYPATLASLRRTQVGKWRVEEAMRLPPRQ